MDSGIFGRSGAWMYFKMWTERLAQKIIKNWIEILDNLRGYLKDIKGDSQGNITTFEVSCHMGEMHIL